MQFLSFDIAGPYPFHKDKIHQFDDNIWVKKQWPLVYFIYNDQKMAYVGESTNGYQRMRNHLANPDRSALKKILVIGSETFNKSATLDIEAKLIQYLTAEGTYKLQNGNYGHTTHNYHQQEKYIDLFKDIWSKLYKENLVAKSLKEITNSELFKYSPYKSLNEDQYKSVVSILSALNKNSSSSIFISGSAGTGKTILATYLIKLLMTPIPEDSKEDLNEEEAFEVSLLKEFRNKYNKPKIGLVVAMTSLRETLKLVFSKIPDLKSTMVISPSESFDRKGKFDLLIVDESHRLRKYNNISWRGAFKNNNNKLGLDHTGTELDWILANSKNQIFFYDSAQSVKPSDVDEGRFLDLLNRKDTIKLSLRSQMRVKGGNDYIDFVDNLFRENVKPTNFKSDHHYQLLLFDKFADLFNEIKSKEQEHQLCRLVAGISWEWKSDPKKSNPDRNAIDIEIEGLKFQWNQTDRDWINNPKDPNNPLKEIGCIHTVQGYDLNYVGVIFGKEIDYDPKTGEFIIDVSQYHDKYGKAGTEKELLKSYILNIYKTLMYRGIKGTYLYVVNENLRSYFSSYMETFSQNGNF